MLYKISGTWGNHEGSLLLWVLILSSFTFWVSKKKQINNNLLFSILGVQTLILCLFLAFILFTSNPFERVETIALEGRGLNPLLQDPGLAFHPPMLYIGYVGLSVSFSFAVGALITGKINKEWAQQIRPWISISWSALTLGIALGSWWAYYELGWGGWWFWDPVENASFMPWLIATALLHSIRILEKRLIFVNWCILLSILGFSFSLLGTFIVRSGLLTSVHSFATDPSRGVFILIIMIISIGGPLILYALKSSIFKEPKVQFNLLSKESALLINNLFFTTATATVLIGTLYPLFLDALSGAKISIGPAYYNATFAPIMTPIILLMAIAPFLNWGKGKSKNLLKIIALLTLTSLIAAFSLSTINGSSIFAIICGTLSFWLFVGVISDFFVKIKETKLKITKMGSIFLYISKTSMKRLPLIIIILLISCDNPLNRVYKPVSYEDDLKKIERYDRFAAKKIEFVIEYELPKYGTTYQELSDRFYEIQKEVQIQDSMIRIKLRSLKTELDSVTKNLNNLKIN